MNGILFLTFMFFTLTSLGQVKIYNLSLTDSTKNILYCGLQNRIKIYGSDSISKVELTSSIKKCFKDIYEKNLFLLHPNMIKTDTINVLINGSLVLVEKYECKRLSDPIPILANTRDLLISKKQIKSDPRLSIVHPDGLYKHQYQVVRYDIFFLLFEANSPYSQKRKFKNRKTGEYKLTYEKIDNSTVAAQVTHISKYKAQLSEMGDPIVVRARKTNFKKAQGGSLNQGHLSIIEEMQRGDMIIFRNIVVRSTSSSDMNMNPLVITIKD